jgi:hypothetical protein
MRLPVACDAALLIESLGHRTITNPDGGYGPAPGLERKHGAGRIPTSISAGTGRFAGGSELLRLEVHRFFHRRGSRGKRRSFMSASAK